MGNIRLRLAFMLFFFVVGVIQFGLVGGAYYTMEMKDADKDNAKRVMPAITKLANSLEEEVVKRHIDSKERDRDFERTQEHFRQIAELTNAEAVYLMVPYRDTVWEYVYDSSNEDVLGSEDNLDDVGAWIPPSVLDAVKEGKTVYSPLHHSQEYGWLSTSFSPVRGKDGHIYAVVGIDVGRESLRAPVIAGLRELAFRFWTIMLINILLFDLMFGRKCCGTRFKFLRDKEDGCYEAKD